MPPATIESATMPMASVRVGWRMRSGAKSAVSPGSERRMVVASAPASPLRAASMPSTSSRSWTISSTVA